MRLPEPRITPVPLDEWPDEAPPLAGPLVEAGQTVNVFATLARHPALMRRWMRFANHVLFKSTLPPRERELVVLRVGHLCDAAYEWGQHVLVARREGVTDDEIRRVRLGPDAAGWSDLDRLVLTATDELHADSFVTDATWDGLAAHWSEEQLMDLVFTIGQYVLVSMALNSFGVQPDPGLPGWDVGRATSGARHQT